MTTIYIATHKMFQKPKVNGYRVLQVGAEGKKDLGYLRDNEGENISGKNAHYCELTGLYWIWKNGSGSDKVGLVHYRRYFSKYRFSTSEKGFLSAEDVEEYLKYYDMILPRIEYLKESAWQEYFMVSGLEKDLCRVRAIIQNRCPEYIEAFDQYFQGNRSHLYNMMICSKDLLDQYCKWLFGILFELEEEIDYQDYNDYQSRIFGFMSERLLNVWVLHNRLKIKQVRTVNTEMSGRERIRIFLRRIKNRMVFGSRWRFE